MYFKREEGFSEENIQIKIYLLESWQFYKFVHKTVMVHFFFLLAQKFLRFDRNDPGSKA